jgi:hypothetical protein
VNRKVWRLGIRLVVRPSGTLERQDDRVGERVTDDQEPMLFG